jgi:hypothetical protein
MVSQIVFRKPNLVTLHKTLMCLKSAFQIPNVIFPERLNFLLVLKSYETFGRNKKNSFKEVLNLSDYLNWSIYFFYWYILYLFLVCKSFSSD